MTGANVGLGYYTALHLAKKGSEVILGCRSASKCAEAAKTIQAVVPGAKLLPMLLDLGSLKSVAVFAEQVKGSVHRLDHVGTVADRQPSFHQYYAIAFELSRSMFMCSVDILLS